ncbi:MAG: hypothetical protein P1P90_03520 [Patescibacteria group bacterium]|nr:hypothetical protein [Patescibacteria group bacterium]
MYIEPTIKNILSQSWEIFQSNIKAIIIITLIIYIPLNIVLEVLPTDDSMEGIMMYFRAMQLLEGLFGILATIAIALLTKAVIENKPISWQESLKLAINKWPLVIGTNLIAGILLVGLFLLLIVPGIIYSFYWYFIIYIVIFSDKWGMQAMKYSKEVVQNRWWKTLGFAILFGIITLIVAAAAGIPLIFLPDSLPFLVFGDLIIDIVVSFFSVLGAVFYLAWDSSKIETPAKSIAN